MNDQHWLYELIDGLAEYEDQHPKLYRDGANGFVPYEECLEPLVKLIPADVMARALAYMRGWRAAEEKHAAMLRVQRATNEAKERLDEVERTGGLPMTVAAGSTEDVAQPSCRECGKPGLVVSVENDFIKTPTTGGFIRQDPIQSSTVTLHCGHQLTGREGWDYAQVHCPSAQWRTK